MTKAQKKNEKRKEKRREGASKEEDVPDDWDEELDEKGSGGSKEAEEPVGEDNKTGEEESKAGEDHTPEKKIRALRKKLRQVSLACPLWSGKSHKLNGLRPLRLNNCARLLLQRRRCFRSSRGRLTPSPNSRRNSQILQSLKNEQVARIEAKDSRNPCTLLN
jgi:hypothetical protein